jgi:hypothetical protein
MSRTEINHIKRVTAIATANSKSEKSSLFVRAVLGITTVAVAAAGLGILLKFAGLL